MGDSPAFIKKHPRGRFAGFPEDSQGERGEQWDRGGKKVGVDRKPPIIRYSSPDWKGQAFFGKVGSTSGEIGRRGRSRETFRKGVKSGGSGINLARPMVDRGGKGKQKNTPSAEKLKRRSQGEGNGQQEGGTCSAAFTRKKHTHITTGSKKGGNRRKTKQKKTIHHQLGNHRIKGGNHR